MNVIIVDDEKNALELLKMECAGIEDISVAGEFTDPAEALRYAGANRVDIAVLDIEMPEMSGIELGKKLKEIDEDIVLMYISAYDAYAMEAYRLQAPVYIEKPYSRQDIVSAFETVKKLARQPKQQENGKKVFIRTFGYFDVYLDGQLIYFKNKKSKEFLALLVDRRGAEVTNDQAITALWEDSVNNIASQSKLRRVVKDLRDTLSQAGIDYILSSRYNSKAVNPDSFACDYYWLLEGDEKIRQLYAGKYMLEYSWAEETVADLYRRYGV